ncbi:hypothetical protein F5Y14DRAFT_405109, partial [Nemania sp. NC0429]
MSAKAVDAGFLVRMVLLRLTYCSERMPLGDGLNEPMLGGLRRRNSFTRTTTTGASATNNAMMSVSLLRCVIWIALLI